MSRNVCETGKLQYQLCYNYHARVHFEFARDAIFCVYDNFWRKVFCAFNIYNHHLSLINTWISRKNLHVCEKDDAYLECFKIVMLQFAIGLAKYQDNPNYFL